MTHSLNRYWHLLARYLRPLRAKTALLALLIFSTIGLQLLNPQIIRYFIDTALATGSGETQTAPLALAALTFFVATLLLQGLTIAATYVGEDVGWRATNQLRNDLARHCLRLDMSFHNQHTPGEMIERLDGDVAEIAIFFAQFVLRVIGNLILLVGVVIVLWTIDRQVSLALAAYALFALFCFVFARRKATPIWEATRQTAADLFGFFEEHLSATEDIRSSGAVQHTMHTLFKLSKQRLRSEKRSATQNILFGSQWGVLYLIGQLIAFTFAWRLFNQGAITLGTAYLIIHYNDRLLHPLDQITQQLQNVQKAVAGISRVFALFALTSNVQDARNVDDDSERQLADQPLALSFEDVTFGYTAGEPVLNHISFTLPAGQVMGLLGRTGSGKTTITRLLYRLYDPNSGAIRLGSNLVGAADGVAINQLKLADLRRRIGMVTQDVQLFHASVRDNLTFFDRSISDQRILAVIDTLELREWFDRLPQGLDTELQSEGNSLSAGEAQLLAFTRVFLQAPQLVILDEASSRLDPATERLLERAVDKLLHNRTAIIIAHRLSTVQRADQIVILQDGRIHEQGARQTLASDPQSRFYELLQTGLTEVLA